MNLLTGTSKATDHSIEKEVKVWLKLTSDGEIGVDNKKCKELNKRRQRGQLLAFTYSRRHSHYQNLTLAQ